MNESKRESDKDEEGKQRKLVLHTGSWQKNRSKPILETAQFLAINKKDAVRDFVNDLITPIYFH